MLWYNTHYRWYALVQVTTGSGKTFTIGSGTIVTIGSGTTVTTGSGTTVNIGSGTMVTISSGTIVTIGCGTTLAVPHRKSNWYWGKIFGTKMAGGVKLTTHHHPVKKLRMRGAILPLPYTLSQRAQRQFQLFLPFIKF